MVPHDRTRDHGHSCKQSRFLLNIIKPFFTVKVSEQHPRETVESPSLEMSKTQLATVLVALLEQVVGVDDLQGPFQPAAF